MMKRNHRPHVLPTTLRLLCTSVFSATAAVVLRSTVKPITATVGSLRPPKTRSARHHHRLSLVLQQPLRPCRSGLCWRRLPRQATPNLGILLRSWIGQRSHSLSREGSVGVLAVSTSASASGSSSAGAERIVTIRGETEAEETIKKSRFVGRCGPATTFEEAKALLERVLKEHPKARHSCWAWKGLGDDHRFSDDGEPGGTAGQPILGAIESEGLSDVMVVVTRYFGGIKLGTGGLCRAYAGGARRCLQAAERETRTPVLQLSVTAPIGFLGGVYHAVSECQRLSEEFTTNGDVVLRIAVELGQVDDVRRRLQDATKGAAAIAEADKKIDD